MILAASRAGISGWNNGYFNIGSQSSASCRAQGSHKGVYCGCERHRQKEVP